MLHGGGYVFGSHRSHRALAARLSAAGQSRVFVADYRLAPKHPFPAAADDALTAYRWLLASGVASDRIALVGDSAGGHLVSCLLGDLRRLGIPGPAAAVLMSPALDLTGDDAAARDGLSSDPVLSPTYGRKCFQAYLGDAAPTNPRVDVFAADKAEWPPTLIQVGDTECLLGDAERLTAALGEAGVDCELQVWPGQVHVFQAFARKLPEAREAIEYAGAFIRDHLPTADLDGDARPAA